MLMDATLSLLVGWYCTRACRGSIRLLVLYSYLLVSSLQHCIF